MDDSGLVDWRLDDWMIRVFGTNHLIIELTNHRVVDWRKRRDRDPGAEVRSQKLEDGGQNCGMNRMVGSFSAGRDG